MMAAPAGDRTPEKVSRQPAFVMRMRPWSETSLLVDVLTRDRGRVLLRARGAKRPTSPWRGVLSEFSPLLVSWSGSSATKTLTHLEWMGDFSPREGDCLISAFYLNELIMRLTALEDAHPGVFEAYWETLKALAQPASAQAVETALRRFELKLLSAAGYALPEHFEDGEYALEGAELVRVTGAGPASAGLRYDAEVLRRIVKQDFSAAETARAAKSLLRAVITAVAGDKPLRTRKILSELRHL